MVHDEQSQENAGTDQTQALRHTTSRLRSQFPELDADQIEQVVHDKYQDFDQSPIRNFVPILVERAAHSALKQAAPRHRA